MQNHLVGVVFEVSEQHVKLFELANQFMGWALCHICLNSDVEVFFIAK